MTNIAMEKNPFLFRDQVDKNKIFLKIMTGEIID